MVSQIGSAKSVLPGRGHGLEIDSQGNLYYATFSSGTIEIPNVGNTHFSRNECRRL